MAKARYDYPDVYRQAFTITELQNMRRQYAKAANQRLVRLERSGANMGNIPNLDYLGERKRFSENPKYLEGQRRALQREISVLTGFLGSKRSTKSGRREIASKTRKTLKERYGVDLDPEETEFLLNNFDDFKAAVKMNSDALLQVIGETSGDITNKDQIKQIVNELRNKRTTRSQAEAIWKSVYKDMPRSQKPAKGETINNLMKAILK